MVADPATDYAESVVAGRCRAGRLVRLACQRHLRDVAGGAGRGLRWDVAAGLHAVEFVRSYLRLAGGEHEGKPFEPSPWQVFITVSLFGWKGPDGYRRFRTAYVEIAKGNGKSPLAAAIGLYMLVADGEPRAEVYAAATKKDQAMILFRDAVAMVDQSPDISKRLTRSGAKGREWNLAHHTSGSFFRAISSDDGQSGPRVHGGLIDELHEHKTPLVVDMMRAGTKGRTQALIFEITNSGTDRDGVCWRHHEYSEKVLTGAVQNDSWFAFIAGLDPCEQHTNEGKTQPVEGCHRCDDWRDESTWIKANPNLGISVTSKYLREQVEEARGMPGKEGIVKRLNFCLWAEGERSWLPPALWERGAGRIPDGQLAGRVCYGGLDVASKSDVMAWALVFPDFPGRGQYAVRCRFWLPREAAAYHERENGIPYSVWEREGWVTLIDGGANDLDVVEAAIRDDANSYLLQESAFDPWNAAQISTHLQQYGIRVVSFGQNIRNFNEPTKEFESLLKQGKLKHGSNPVLDWMASNVAVYTDLSGNVRPVKPEHTRAKKVDGIIAVVMALARAMLAGPTSSGGVDFW